MKIKDVERYTIPLDVPYGGEALPDGKAPTGTTVEELIKALKKLPPKGLVSHDFGGNSRIIVTHYKPDIDPDCPFEAAMQQAIKEMASATWIPPQYFQ
ncbi:Hypothetical Protein PBI_L5_45 [Fromanvirus L5]|uniref:Gene 45 protein n=1 Tax=Mycobacterium phage L5 TaxID=31757 RepID=VG45_BPML5|nr:Hypothetical Protein PBI_L5_45 [Fromanvirus L5]Q05256.1 RecName: Full=Gene 45 protein; AltName: Full=Gp45 [Fromanvirus L5]CAA79421.1 Hypothetical Protein PBI_L5_45 [Fromanvirus L5]